MPAGRPSMYTPELGRKICNAVATTTESLKKICDAHDDFPCKDTVNEWKWTYPEFSVLYANAKAQQADLFAEEILEISDYEAEDLIATKDGYVGNSTKVARDRLRADSRKWIACKLLPKVYGDKKEVVSEVTVSVHERDLEALK